MSLKVFVKKIYEINEVPDYNGTAVINVLLL